MWATDIKTPQNQGDSQYTGIDVVFVIDSSGSMWDNDRSGLRKEAAKAFVDKLGSNDRAAVIDFDHDASVYQDFTSDHTNLKNAINRINSSGGTDLGAGMDKAISLFTNSSYTRTDAYKYIIFLTVGLKKALSKPLPMGPVASIILPLQPMHFLVFTKMCRLKLWTTQPIPIMMASLTTTLNC